jgi:hypothetical protein
MGHSPATLRAAAAVQAAEAVLVLAATVLAGIDTAAGRSYQVGSGIALTAIGVACVAGLALVAAGLARGRRWSRTPALLTQLFLGIVGISLLQGQRFDWGVLSVVLAVAGLAALLAPPSLRALAGQQQRRPQPSRPGQPKQPPGSKQTGQSKQPAGSKQPAWSKQTGQPKQSAGSQPPGQANQAGQAGRSKRAGQARPNRRRSARPGAE